jgi:hypothetical protein
VRARKARRIVFSIALSRQPSPALLFFKLIEVETKFPFANSISAFSRSQDPYRKSASRQWSSHSGHRPFPVSDVHSVSRLFGISVFKTIASQSHFQAANWYSALETKVGSPTLSLEKRGIPAKQEALLISDWQRQCPRPMVQMKPVTQPADGGEGAIPYCWSWRWDFLFLAPPRAHCIMRCSR